MLGHSGNQYQDSISALSDIDASFFNSYHTFGLDWSPGQVPSPGRAASRGLQSALTLLADAWRRTCPR